MERKVSLYLSDLLKNNNIDIKDVILIRHVMSHEGFRKCYDMGFIQEYTSLQKEGFADGYKYWMIFISDEETKAKYYKTFEVKGEHQRNLSMMPESYPCPQHFLEEGSQFELHECDVLKDLQDRLIIDWGKSARSWYQKAANEKPVVSIQSDDFPGYENLILTFDELSRIMKSNNKGYISTLKHVKAVYLITDKATGKQYVGSAYGDDGLYGRWMSYVNTYHGGNVMIKEYLEKVPDGYKTFQYSILQIFSLAATVDEVINAESLYKIKLMTRVYGWNDN